MEANEIRALSTRLQTDLLVLGGRLPGPVPRFNARLLVPLGVLAGTALWFALHPAARNGAFLSLGLRATAGVLQLVNKPT